MLWKGYRLLEDIRFLKARFILQKVAYYCMAKGLASFLTVNLLFFPRYVPKGKVDCIFYIEKVGKRSESLLAR